MSVDAPSFSPPPAPAAGLDEATTTVTGTDNLVSVNTRSFSPPTGSGAGFDESTTGMTGTENLGTLTSTAFAAVAELNKSYPPPNFLMALSHCIMLVQVVFGSCYLFDPVHEVPNGLGIFLRVIFFGLIGDYATFLPFFLGLLFLQVITFGLMAAVLINSLVHHQDVVWLMWLVRIWNTLFFGSLVIPNVMFGILSIAYYGHGDDWRSLLVMISGLVTSIWVIVYSLTLTVSLSQSPYLFPGVILHWDQRSAYMTLVLYGVALGLGGVFQKTGLSWQRFVGPVTMLIVGVHAIRKVFSFPCRGLAMNVILASIASSGIAGSVMAIVRDAGVPVPVPCQIAAPVIGCFGSMFLWAPIMACIRKKRMSQLSYSVAFEGAMSVSEQAKFEYLRSLKINSVPKALSYLRLGLEGGCDLFLDWALTKYLFKKKKEFSDDDLLMFMAMEVAFFPSETVMLHSLMEVARKMKNPSFANSAMRYQLHRIYIFRHSSSSRELTEDFNRVKKSTEQCISSYCQFWRDLANGNGEPSVDVYSLLAHIGAGTDAIWTEMLDKYPNNTMFVEYYASYLLNAKCFFKESVEWHQTAKELDQGTKILKDKVFHRFIAAFPFYAEKKLVDANGKLKPEPVDLLAKANQQNFGQPVTSDPSEIDEKEAERYVGQFKLKCAMQQAVQELRSRTVFIIHVSAGVRLVITLLYLVIVTAILAVYFDNKLDLFGHLTRLNKVHASFGIIAAQIPIVWAKDLWPDRTQGELLTSWNITLFEEALKDRQRVMYETAVAGLAQIDNTSSSLYYGVFENGEETVLLTKLLANSSVVTGSCTEFPLDVGESDASITLDNLIRLFFTTSVNIVFESRGNKGQWQDSREMCQILIRAIEVAEAFKHVGALVSPTLGLQLLKIRENGTSDFGDIPLLSDPKLVEALGTPIYPIESQNKTGEHRNVHFLIAFSPAILVFVAMPTTILFISGLQAEVMEYSSILSSFSRDDCLLAGERTSVMPSTEEMQVNLGVEKIDRKYRWIASITWIVLLICLLLFQLVYTLYTDNQISSISQQYALFNTVRNDIFDIASQCVLMVLLHEASRNGIFTVSYLEYSDCLKRIQRDLIEIKTMDAMLDLGYEDSLPSLGFDRSLDQMRFMEKCYTPVDSYVLSDYWMCLSFSRLRSYFLDQVKTVVATVDWVKMFDSKMATLVEIINTRFPTDFMEISNKYEELMEGVIKQHRIAIWTCFCLSIVVAVIAFGTELWITRSCQRDFQTYQCLLMRLNPISLVSNPQAAALLFGKTTLAKVQATSAAHAVFNNSQDAMLYLNQEEVIEVVNPATTATFGFTARQLLGQYLRLIINPDIGSNKELYYEMQLMKSGQCSLLYHTKVTASKDDKTAVPLRVILVGLSSNDRTADNFGLICHDLREEEATREQVKDIKEESERLLEQVIPSGMLSKMNDDITYYTIQTATVGYLRVCIPDDYIATLEPITLMDYMSQILKELDANLSHFPRLARVKVVGNNYITAGGLFPKEPDFSQSANDIAQAANDVIEFNIQAMETVEKLNIKFDNTNFQSRIGIHTGGPLIVSVLGNPGRFDIMGGTTGIAERLQEQCAPDKLIISTPTYDSIAKSNSYKIEEYQELTLPGVGSAMTYTVTKSQHQVSHQGFGSRRGGRSVNDLIVDIDIDETNLIDPCALIDPIAPPEPSADTPPNTFPSITDLTNSQF